MCWTAMTIGIVLLVAGAVVLVRFFAVGGPRHVELAGQGLTESMVLGAIMSSLGLLLTILGGTGVICRSLGITP